ncbi:recombinase family protein [Jannaschia marina]|uniref:recombinase family protein n=1 Tax=Jannaschia marina TaxID=2741674 RepID=UPI0038B3C89A
MVLLDDLGKLKRGTGILNNELYIGARIWNRQRFVKDPGSGKRQAFPNPPEAWIREDVPDLRIVDQDLWDEVKARQGATRSEIFEARDRGDGPQAHKARRAQYLLTGTAECGMCGANYIMISAERMGCSAARNRGTCENRKTLKRVDLEERVLGGLRKRLMAPDMIRTFIETFQEEAKRDRRSSEADRAKAKQELTKVKGEIDNIVEAIAQGMFQSSMKAKIDGLETRKAELEAALAALPAEEPVLLHPGLADVFARKVEGLIAALNEEGAKTEAGELIRGLIDRIVLTPDTDAPNGHVVALQGELAGILGLCGKYSSGPAMARRSGVRSWQGTVVAGVGFEPTTFRL